MFPIFGTLNCWIANNPMTLTLAVMKQAKHMGGRAGLLYP